MSMDEIKEKLEVNKIKHKVHFMKTIATTGDGVNECIDQIQDQVYLKKFGKPLNETHIVKDIPKPLAETYNDVKSIKQSYLKSFIKFFKNYYHF